MTGAEVKDILVLAQHDSDSVNALAMADRSMKERVPFETLGAKWQVTSIRTERGLVVIAGRRFQ